MYAELRKPRVAEDAAAYVAATLVRYYLLPPAPRFPVESAFFIFVGIGVLAVLVRPANPETGWPAAGPQRPGRQVAVLALAFVLALPSAPGQFSADGLGLASDLPTVALFALTLAASCAVAAISYYAVELPFLRRKDRRR